MKIIRELDLESNHSEDEIIRIVTELLSEKDKLLFIENKKYNGRITGNKFKFYKTFNSRYSLSNPKVYGEVIKTDKTRVKIKITPHFIRIIFFMIFPLIFFPLAILINEITVNGVLKKAELLDRIMLAGVGGVMPLLLGYIDAFSKFDSTEKWLKKTFSLKFNNTNVNYKSD